MPPPRKPREQILSGAESETSFGGGTGMVNNRDNSAYKWQRARGVVGALEVRSEPTFNYRSDLIPRYVKGREKTFRDALQAWDDLKLRESFIKACDSLPAAMCCCALLRDHDQTIKDFVSLLNDGWCKHATKQLHEYGLKVDCFLWTWQNASGKAETNIMVLRFYELSSYRLRQASQSGSFDLDELDLDDLDSDVAEGSDLFASHRSQIEASFRAQLEASQRSESDNKPKLDKKKSHRKK